MPPSDNSGMGREVQTAEILVEGHYTCVSAQPFSDSCEVDRVISVGADALDSDMSSVVHTHFDSVKVIGRTQPPRKILHFHLVNALPLVDGLLSSNSVLDLVEKYVRFASFGFIRLTSPSANCPNKRLTSLVVK